MKKSENEKKQIVLRLSSSLWKELSQWSSEEFRSINGQIEYSFDRKLSGSIKRVKRTPPTTNQAMAGSTSSRSHCDRS